MASPPTSRLAFRAEAGEPLDAPLEWTTALLHIDCDVGLFSTLHARCNGEPLEILTKLIDGTPRLVCVWPRSGAGTYHLEVETVDGSWEQHHTCFVEPQKLSPSGVQAMLVELQRLPASIAISLQRGGALAGLHLIPPQQTTLAEELDRLRRALLGTPSRPGLPAVLRATAEDPYRVLRTHDVWTPTERARRIHPTGLRRAYQQPTNLDPDHRPIRVPEIRIEHTADVYENRLLRTYCDQVNVRLRSAVNALNAGGNESLRDEARDLLRLFISARRPAAFLDDVGLLTEAPTRLTMVLLRRPAYRAGLEGFLEFRRSALVKLKDAALSTPLENIPSLYETWGTLEVINTLLHEAIEAGFTVHREQLISHTPGQVWITVLRNGNPAVELEDPVWGRHVRLIPQRTYSTGSAGLRSISFRQVPDIAIEIIEPSGETAIYLFDPKYKLDSEESAEGTPASAKPKKRDIDAIHSYRDSIRGNGDERLVQFAAILYPGPDVRYDDGLAAFNAQPADPEPLREATGRVLAGALAESHTQAA
jgi:predicted component of viral defense system (DUF524 family)